MFWFLLRALLLKGLSLLAVSLNLLGCLDNIQMNRLLIIFEFSERKLNIQHAFISDFSSLNHSLPSTHNVNNYLITFLVIVFESFSWGIYFTFKDNPLSYVHSPAPFTLNLIVLITAMINIIIFSTHNLF